LITVQLIATEANAGIFTKIFQKYGNFLTNAQNPPCRGKDPNIKTHEMAAVTKKFDEK
jgi:hypothetical protein